MNERPEIKKPVFILGPERSGTTLLYSLLANADEFYWFSRIDSLLPSWPHTAELCRRLFNLFEKKPFISKYGKIARIKGVNTPTECNSYWKRFFGWGDEENYRIDNDRFLEYDLSPEQKQFVINDFKRRLTYAGKRRILLKQPGFSLKLRFWNRVFPDAFYLICIRSIEDNVISLMAAKNESDEEFWGTKVNGWKDYREAGYRTQALLQLKKIYSAMAEDLSNEEIARRAMIVSYERLLSEPEHQIKKAAQFCGINWNNRIGIASKGIIRQDLSPDPKVDLLLSVRQVMKKLENRAADLFELNCS